MASATLLKKTVHSLAIPPVVDRTRGGEHSSFNFPHSFTIFSLLDSLMHPVQSCQVSVAVGGDILVENPHVNPLSPEFKIPAEPINAGDKMAAPRREPISLRITLYSPFIQPNWLH